MKRKILSLGMTLALLTVALFPSVAAAAPAQKVMSLTLAKTSIAVKSKLKSTFSVSKKGKVTLQVLTSKNKQVFKKAFTLKANAKFSYTWDGKAQKGNAAKLKAGTYVPVGSYKVKVTADKSSKSKSFTVKKAAKPAPSPNPPAAEFKVTSTGIVNGVIADKYGKRGDLENSLPLTITGAPTGTKSYAVTLIDPDAVPVCGYEWIHWLAAGMTDTTIVEGASKTWKSSIVQGKNSSGVSAYEGPMPPDKTHTYVITVYALSTADLGLSNGFSLSALESAMSGKILDKTTLKGSYKN